MKDSEIEPFVLETERALDASNRGYHLLLQMGWRSGVGLGKHEQGQLLGSSLSIGVRAPTLIKRSLM